MENVEKYICDKVSAYADEVLDGIDPQKVQVSFHCQPTSHWPHPYI